MPRSKKDVEKGLRRKGFVQAEGDHHFFVYHTFDGLDSGVYTKTSHSPKYKDLGDDLIKKMADQCRLTKKQFLKLVNCPLSQKDYEKILNDLDQVEPTAE